MEMKLEKVSKQKRWRKAPVSLSCSAARYVLEGVALQSSRWKLSGKLQGKKVLVSIKE
jgi:hypothetical protein